MEKVTVWTNYFDNVRIQVEELLKSGKAVRVGASCIGHTRAQMVVRDAQKHMEEIGAEVYEEGFYCLKSAQKPKKRGRKPKKERL